MIGLGFPAFTPIHPDPQIAAAIEAAEQEHYLASPPADMFMRAGAFFLDGLFYWILSSAILKVAGILSLWLPLQSNDSGVWLFRITLYLAYTSAPLVYFGATPAKLLMGLRVIRKDSGKGLTWKDALIREGLGKIPSLILLGIPAVLGFFDPQRSCFHDRIAGTVVRQIHDPL